MQLVPFRRADFCERIKSIVFPVAGPSIKNLVEAPDFKLKSCPFVPREKACQ